MWAVLLESSRSLRPLVSTAQGTSDRLRTLWAISITGRFLNSGSIATESRLVFQGRTHVRQARSRPASLPWYSVLGPPFKSATGSTNVGCDTPSSVTTRTPSFRVAPRTGKSTCLHHFSLVSSASALIRPLRIEAICLAIVLSLTLPTSSGNASNSSSGNSFSR